MKTFADRIINRLIEAIYLGVLFLLPLYFAVILPTNNVFELNKIILFKIFVLLLLFFTLIKFLYKKSSIAVAARQNYKFLFTPVLFILVYAVASLFSVNREASIYGLYSRQLGLISNFYFFLFFILLLVNIKAKEQILRIVKAVALSSLIVSIYGLVQATGYDPLPWSESTQLRATSSFGQPNLLAMYMLLVLPFGFYLLVASKKLALKVFYFFIILTNLFCLFFTYSLSGWVGLIVGAIATVIILLVASLKKKSFFVISSPANAGREIFNISLTDRTGNFLKTTYHRFLKPVLTGFRNDKKESGRVRNDKEKKGLVQNDRMENSSYNAIQQQYNNLTIKQLFNRKTLIIVTAVLIILSASIFAVNKIQNKWVFKDRLASLVNLQSGSLASRYNWWHAGYEAIKKRPWLGYGPETQSDVLVGYYQPNWGIYENTNIRPDRAHNLFLDIILTTGVIGLMAYLALLILFFFLLLKIIKNISEYRILAYCLTLAVISYLIALQLNFTFVVGEIYFWLYLALVLIICHSSRRDYGGNPGLTGTNSSSRQGLFDKFIRFYPACPPKPRRRRGFPTVPLQRDFENDKKRKRLFLLRRGGMIALLIILTLGAFYLINNQIKFLTADYYFRELRVARENNQYFGAIKMYEFIKENVPAYGFYDRQFADIMADWLEKFDNPGFRKYGEEKLAQILPQIKSENYDDIYTKAVIFKTLAGQDREDYFQQAEDEFKKVIALSPEMPNNYIELAKLYVKRKWLEDAVSAYELAASKLPDLNHPDINADHKRAVEKELYNIYLDIGDIYLAKKDYQQAKSFYEKAVNLNEKIVNAYGKLADLFFAQSDFKQAIWYNKKAMELDSINYQWPLAIAQIYQKTGEKDKAAEYLKKVEELSPKN